MRIGIDLGGTKIEVIALSVSGETLFRHRVATPRDDYQRTLEEIAGLVRLAKSLAQVVNFLDPETIVLDGGMSNNDRLYQTVP